MVGNRRGVSPWNSLHAVMDHRSYVTFHFLRYYETCQYAQRRTRVSQHKMEQITRNQHPQLHFSNARYALMIIIIIFTCQGMIDTTPLSIRQIILDGVARASVINLHSDPQCTDGTKANATDLIVPSQKHGWSHRLIFENVLSCTSNLNVQILPDSSNCHFFEFSLLPSIPPPPPCASREPVY